MKFHPWRDPGAALAWPIVLGHFLPWYTVKGSDFPLDEADAVSMDWQPQVEDMRHWCDPRAEYRRTHLEIPEIGVYDSRNPEVIEWQIRMAVLHGVSGFIVNWYGRHSVENVITLHWLRGLEAWNRAHPETPFVYILSYDMQAQWPSEGKRPVSLEEDLAYIRRHLLRDAYLCRDGRPLIMVFPYGDARREFRSAVDRVFERPGADVIWSGAPSGPNCDACYAWVRPDASTIREEGPCTWTDPDNCGEQDLRLFYDEANRAGDGGRYIVHGAWPGFDSSLVAWAWIPDPQSGRVRPRIICRETSAGSTLDRTWGVYLDYLSRIRAGDPLAQLPAPIVQLVTWNDYAETTNLEPTLDRGRQPLERCLRFIERARSIGCASG